MDGFEMSVEINRPIDEVFAFRADLEHNLDWRREWIEAKMTSEPPVGIGSTFRMVEGALGRRTTTVYETLQFEPNRTVAWKAISGPLPLTFSRTFASTEKGTRVTIRYEGEYRGLLKLLKPLLASMGSRALDGDPPKLKELMNGTQPAQSKRNGRTTSAQIQGWPSPNLAGPRMPAPGVKPIWPPSMN